MKKPSLRRVAEALAESDLSPAETLVVWAIGRGLSNDEIAAELSRSVKTTSNQAYAAYRKLKLFKAAQVAVWGCRNGLIDLSRKEVDEAIRLAGVRKARVAA